MLHVVFEIVSVGSSQINTLPTPKVIRCQFIDLHSFLEQLERSDKPHPGLLQFKSRVGRYINGALLSWLSLSMRVGSGFLIL